MKFNLEDNYDKKVVARWVVGIFSLCAIAICVFLLYWNQRIFEVDVSGCEIDDSSKIVYEITKTYGTNYIEFEGYAYLPGVTIDRANVNILAYNPENEKYYKLPTECMMKKNVTKKADDGYNYDYSGFETVVFAKKLVSGTRFFLRYQNDGRDILVDIGEDFYY